jgi:hypothetical protein
LSKEGRCLPYFFALALVGAGMLTPAPAMAQKVECSAIMGAVKAGNLYAVTVLKGKGQIKIETMKGYCYEPIEKWKARGLPMASLGSGSFIAPPKKKKKIYTPPPIPTSRLTAPPPTSAYMRSKRVLPPPGKYRPGATPPSAEGATGVPPGSPAKGPADLGGKAGAAGEEAIPKPPVRKGRCDRAITDFWGPGKIDVKGSPYWLSGAFTIDLDGDGRVDNVGFKLKISGRVGNVIRYFEAPGRLSGQTIPDLKIANDDDISRLCPGDVTFKLPKSERQVVENKVEVALNPAKEAPEKKPQVKKKKGLSGIALVVFSGAGVVLFISGIVILFLLQPEFAARRRKKKEAEEEDEEEES